MDALRQASCQGLSEGTSDLKKVKEILKRKPARQTKRTGASKEVGALRNAKQPDVSINLSRIARTHTYERHRDRGAKIDLPGDRKKNRSEEETSFGGGNRV